MQPGGHGRMHPQWPLGPLQMLLTGKQALIFGLCYHSSQTLTQQVGAVNARKHGGDFERQ
jgi:hypothetical protein